VGSASQSYKGHWYPVEVISHCVWLYFRFPLSFREVEELMLERGIVVSYETVRRWCVKFGQQYAGALRRRQPRPRQFRSDHRADQRKMPAMWSAAR
jgi:putative transposase